MSISHWNSKDLEDHYFFYKKDLNVTYASKLLNISRPTFYKTIEKLTDDELHILKDMGDYYKVYIPKIYAEIDQKILTQLIPYQALLGVDFIRTYAILCRMYQHPEIASAFTKADLIDILGHSKTDNSMYYRVELFLAFLSYEKFIDITFQVKTYCGKQYKEFLLKGINTPSETLDCDNICAINEEKIKKIKEGIKETGTWDIK